MNSTIDRQIPTMDKIPTKDMTYIPGMKKFSDPDEIKKFVLDSMYDHIFYKKLVLLWCSYMNRTFPSRMGYYGYPASIDIIDSDTTGVGLYGKDSVKNYMKYRNADLLNVYKSGRKFYVSENDIMSMIMMDYVNFYIFNSDTYYKSKKSISESKYKIETVGVFVHEKRELRYVINTMIQEMKINISIIESVLYCITTIKRIINRIKNMPTSKEKDIHILYLETTRTIIPDMTKNLNEIKSITSIIAKLDLKFYVSKLGEIEKMLLNMKFKKGK